MKNKNKVYIIMSIMSILIVQYNAQVLAETIITIPVNITLYNNTIQVIGRYSNTDSNFTINWTNGSIMPQSFMFNDYYVSNQTQIINLDTINDLLKCREQFGTTNNSLSTCLSNLNLCQNQSAGYLQCQLLLKDKDLEISTQLKNVNDCKANTSNTSNQGWLWGIGGLALASLFWNKNKLMELGKNKGKSEFNPSQRG
jgi:hypothetical protein